MPALISSRLQISGARIREVGLAAAQKWCKSADLKIPNSWILDLIELAFESSGCSFADWRRPQNVAALVPEAPYDGFNLIFVHRIEPHRDEAVNQRVFYG